jgi:hypothetical protein
MASKARLITNSTVDGSLSASIGQGVNAALVVGAAALGNVGSGTIPLEVVDRDDRRVDGELLIVDTKTVAMGVGVREEPGLEDGICRGLDVGDEMRRRESGLGSFVMRI